MVPVCSMTSSKVIAGEVGSMPIRRSATITCAELETGNSSARPCTMARMITCKNNIVFSPLSIEQLRHRERIAPAGIVVFFDAEFTISMVGPEGNRGIVVCCCFESYFADAVRGHAAFDFV